MLRQFIAVFVMTLFSSLVCHDRAWATSRPTPSCLLRELLGAPHLVLFEPSPLLEKVRYPKVAEMGERWKTWDIGMGGPQSRLPTSPKLVTRLRTQEEREPFRVHILGGKLYDATGRPLDTEQYRIMFVMDPAGNLYMAPQRMGAFHHSSFLSGRPVASAGEVIVSHGVIKKITPKSGHYEPSPEVFGQVIDELRLRGVAVPRDVLDISEIKFWPDNGVKELLKRWE